MSKDIMKIDNHQVNQYDIFELTLEGPAAGNPFTAVSLTGRFRQGGRVLEPEGFYDGDGVYRVRFMPDTPGEWEYTTRSSALELDGQAGHFTCNPARAGDHGPVRVYQRYHFAYADGTRYLPIGTTCYAWTSQNEELERQTLETLRQSSFNKIRMCVFPKHYSYNLNEPELYAFERKVTGEWDFERLNPAFFRHFEQRVGDLREIGVEADIILFHPYDRWGFSDMGPDADDRYLRYLVARLAAYRNVWWSLANEYDIMRTKTEADWERFFRILQQYDPYGHLRSVHNWINLDDHAQRSFYDFSKPWVTHCSIQHPWVDLTHQWREQYRKPVVIDEACYEGNIPHGWGNITAEEMVRRFWDAAVRGGYCGHGETYLHPEDILWWSHGGQLHGGSPARIAFLRQILEEMPPAERLEPLAQITNTYLPSAGIPGQYWLTYFGFRQPGQVTLSLPEEGQYRVDVIDTWEMTVTALEGTFAGETVVALPGKPYIALRVVPA
jgi:hypothetical protein